MHLNLTMAIPMVTPLTVKYSAKIAIRPVRNYITNAKDFCIRG